MLLWVIKSALAHFQLRFDQDAITSASCRLRSLSCWHRKPRADNCLKDPKLTFGGLPKVNVFFKRYLWQTKEDPIHYHLLQPSGMQSFSSFFFHLADMCLLGHGGFKVIYPWLHGLHKEARLRWKFHHSTSLKCPKMSCLLFSNISKLDELVIGDKRTTATETI